MARIIVYSVEDFKKAVERFTWIKTHEVVTDGISTITMVPKTTSRHRHYIQYTANDEQEIHQLLAWLEQRGYTIIHGYVQEVVA